MCSFLFIVLLALADSLLVRFFAFRFCPFNQQHTKKQKPQKASIFRGIPLFILSELSERKRATVPNVPPRTTSQHKPDEHLSSRRAINKMRDQENRAPETPSIMGNNASVLQERMIENQNVTKSLFITPPFCKGRPLENCRCPQQKRLRRLTRGPKVKRQEFPKPVLIHCQMQLLWAVFVLLDFSFTDSSFSPAHKPK